MANPRVQVPNLNLRASSPQPWYFRRVTIALVIGVLFISMLVALLQSEAPTAKVLLLKAEAEFQLGYYRRAAETYTKLIHQYPGIAKYKYFRAMAYAAGNRTDRALSDLEYAISQKPKLATEAREEPRFVPLSRNTKFRDLTRLHP